MGNTIFAKFFICASLAILYATMCEAKSAQHRSCVMKIPRRSILGNCSSELNCREVVDQGMDFGVKCGNHNECILEQSPVMELCKDACVDSDCGILCQQHYTSERAMYCIETRDHPNAYPHGIPAQPNKYFCTCISPNEFIELNLAA